MSDMKSMRCGPPVAASRPGRARGARVPARPRFFVSTPGRRLYNSEAFLGGVVVVWGHADRDAREGIGDSHDGINVTTRARGLRPSRTGSPRSR